MIFDGQYIIIGKRGGSLRTLVEQAVPVLLEAWRMVPERGPAVPAVPIPADFTPLPTFTFSTRSADGIAAAGLVLDEAEFATALPGRCRPS